MNLAAVMRRTGLTALAVGLAACSIPADGASVGGTCVDCHSYMSKASQTMVSEWKVSIHAAKGIGCADCHGGNPKDATFQGAMYKAAGFIGIPTKQNIPVMCAKCHSDPNYMRPFNIVSTSQFAEYKQSIHGKRLAQGDTKVAVCTDCHGVHEIRAPDDVQSSVYKPNIPATCAKCHANAEYMRSYGIPTDQYAEYKQSVHAHKLLVEQDRSAPACSDCHGTHGATPPKVKEVANVCGTCHAKTQEYFNAGPHGASFRMTGVPRCVNCHSNHGIKKPSDAMLVGSGPGHCGSCHGPGTAPYRTAETIHDAIAKLDVAYGGAASALAKAEAANMDVEDDTAELENAKTNLITARAEQHTVTPKRVQAQVTQGSATIKSVDSAARLALAQSHKQKMALVGIGVLILLASSLLWWSWRLSYLRWRAAGNS